jgi:hypothetical protein
MKYGTFNMILEEKDKVCKGNSRQPHDPRKLVCRNQMKTRLIIFFDIKDAGHFEFIQSFHKANESTTPIMWKY